MNNKNQEEQEIKHFWNGIRKGDQVRLIKTIYGDRYGNISHEPIGQVLREQGAIGIFLGKVPKGMAVRFSNGLSGFLALIVEEFDIEKVEQIRL